MHIYLQNAVRRTFTLLELIIAMSLTLILMSTLLYFYRDISTIGLETNKLNDVYFYWQYTGSRLADIIPRTVIKNGDEELYFYSIEDSSLTKPGSQSLVFAFDNKISLANLFSNIVIGRLYVDKKDRLTLAYWPPKSRWKQTELPPMKKEILKENVKSISFDFFVPPGKSETDASETPQSNLTAGPKGSWTSKPWSIEYRSLPAMIKITVIPNNPAKDDPQYVIYTFPLVDSGARIVYE